MTPQHLKEIVALAGQNPIHIHVAEQIAEVEACKKWSGARPVEWLLDNAPVDQRWCLIHATHMTENETQRMARSGAIAGLCPVTEANLGDGVFHAEAFIAGGGDGYSMLKEAKRLMDAESAPIDSTVLENAIRAAGTIAPKTDGRSKRLDQ